MYTCSEHVNSYSVSHGRVSINPEQIKLGGLFESGWRLLFIFWRDLEPTTILTTARKRSRRCYRARETIRCHQAVSPFLRLPMSHANAEAGEYGLASGADGSVPKICCWNGLYGRKLSSVRVLRNPYCSEVGERYPASHRRRYSIIVPYGIRIDSDRCLVV